MDAGLIKAGSKALDVATGGKFGEFQKVNKAKQMIREQTVLDKIEAVDKAENLKGDIQDFYKKYNRKAYSFDMDYIQLQQNYYKQYNNVLQLQALSNNICN